jgi:hypothetical protein
MRNMSAHSILQTLFLIDLLNRHMSQLPSSSHLSLTVAGSIHVHLASDRQPNLTQRSLRSPNVRAQNTWCKLSSKSINPAQNRIVSFFPSHPHCAQVLDSRYTCPSIFASLKPRTYRFPLLSNNLMISHPEKIITRTQLSIGCDQLTQESNFLSLTGADSTLDFGKPS